MGEAGVPVLGTCTCTGTGYLYLYLYRILARVSRIMKHYTCFPFPFIISKDYLDINDGAA